MVISALKYNAFFSTKFFWVSFFEVFRRSNFFWSFLKNLWYSPHKPKLMPTPLKWRKRYSLQPKKKRFAGINDYFPYQVFHVFSHWLLLDKIKIIQINHIRLPLSPCQNNLQHQVCVLFATDLETFDYFMRENTVLAKTFRKRSLLVLRHFYVVVSVSYFCSPFSTLLKSLS